MGTRWHLSLKQCLINLKSANFALISNFSKTENFCFFFFLPSEIGKLLINIFSGRGCRDKNRLKKAKTSVRLILSRVPFKSGA